MTPWSTTRWPLQRAIQHVRPDQGIPPVSAWRLDPNGAGVLAFDGHTLELPLPTTTVTHLRVEKVESLKALRALAPAWRALEKASGNALPFLTFEWVESWWLHFAERHTLVEDRLAVRVVLDQSGADTAS